MRAFKWLAAGAGLLIAFSAPPAVAQPSDVVCDRPSSAQVTNLRTSARDLEFGNVIHARQGQKLPSGFSAVLVADSGTATVVGPRSEVVAEVNANRADSLALERGQIIAKVWTDTAYVAKRDDEGRPDPLALRLPAGFSYIVACVPRGVADGDTITGLVIPEDEEVAPTSLIGTYYTTAPVNALAVWQSSSSSTVCIGCRGGWCQF